MIDPLAKIVEKSARIAVIGLGYAGLPLATGLAEAGCHRARAPLPTRRA